MHAYAHSTNLASLFINYVDINDNQVLEDVGLLISSPESFSEFGLLTNHSTR